MKGAGYSEEAQSINMNEQSKTADRQTTATSKAKYYKVAINPKKTKADAKDAIAEHLKQYGVADDISVGKRLLLFLAYAFVTIEPFSQIVGTLRKSCEEPDRALLKRAYRNMPETELARVLREA